MSATIQRRKQTPRATWSKWSRSLHSWASMVSMLLVLFFVPWLAQRVVEYSQQLFAGH